MPSNIPLLGLGTWSFGGNKLFERDETKRSEGVAALRQAFAIGFRLIDTAEVYSDGLAEEIVGEAAADCQRSEFFLVSKVWKDHLTPAGIQRAIEGSLRRLRTDYLDLYLIHWPSDTAPLSEIMPAMERLIADGLTRTIGVSNFSITQMEEAQSYLKKTTIAANQIEYNLTHRDAENEIIPYCRARNVHVMAYRPLARGALTRERSELLGQLAEKYQKTPTQVVLNWIMSQGHTAIPKASSPEHLRENWGALGWKMSDEDVELLIKY